MLHEPGHQSKRTISLKANAPQSLASPVSSSTPMAQAYPVPEIAQPRPVPKYAQMPQTGAIIKRPGCVTATALVFFVMTITSFFGGLASLLFLDVLGFIGGIGSMFIFGLTGLGLWVMYRWGANLVILFAGASIIQFVLSTVYAMMIIDDYLQNKTAQFMLMLGYTLAQVFFIVILGGIWWWFAKTRRWFLINNLFPRSEKWLYWVAIAVFSVRLLSVLNSVPEQFELQRSQLERFDRDIENINRTPEPPVDNSLFG